MVAFLGLSAYAVSLILDTEEQPLFARRTPPLVGVQSHDSGRVVLSQEAPVAVPCGAIVGLKVAGDSVAGPLLRAAVTDGVCKRLAGIDPALASRVKLAAERGVVISFGIFERTGEDSATIAGQPPRVAINTRYAGAFKGFLLPVLAHELWHAGSVEVTAEEELGARKAEAAMCAFVPSSTVHRGCTDANAIVAAGDAAALAQLRAVGFR